MVDKIWYNMEELIGGSEERGINRNIVECKDVRRFIRRNTHPCINRNIVECKGISGAEKISNVCCINRNIVECKGSAEEIVMEGRLLY